MSFILRFVETVGLRLAKLLGAKLRDLQLETSGWDAPSHDKGAHYRIAAISEQTLDVLQTCLGRRGLDNLQNAPP